MKRLVKKLLKNSYTRINNYLFTKTMDLLSMTNMVS